MTILIIGLYIAGLFITMFFGGIASYFSEEMADALNEKSILVFLSILWPLFWLVLIFICISFLASNISQVGYKLAKKLFNKKH